MRPPQARWGPCPHCKAMGWWTPSTHVGPSPLHDHNRPHGGRCWRAACKVPDCSPSSLHARIAAALGTGWTVAQTKTFSLQALRELVRPVSPKLSNEITLAIEHALESGDESVLILDDKP